MSEFSAAEIVVIATIGFAVVGTALYGLAVWAHKADLKAGVSHLFDEPVRNFECAACGEVVSERVLKNRVHCPMCGDRL